MTQENAKERIPQQEKGVIIVDDDDAWADTIREFCEMYGHKILGMANSLEKAEELIKKIQESGKSIDLALLDGNLDKYSSGGHDGERLAGIVRRQFPHAAVISISGNRQSWSDKPNLSAVDLPELLESIKNI